MQKKNPTYRLCIIAWLGYALFCPVLAQQPINMNDAVTIALSSHPVATGAALAGQKDALLQQQAVTLAPVQAKYWQRQSPATGNDRLWSVTQDFGIIPEHIRKVKHYQYVASANEAGRMLTLDELAWQVKTAYLELVYYQNRLQVMQLHENYFEALISTAEVYLSADSIKELAIVSAGARYAAYQSRMFIAGEEVKRAENRLRLLLYTEETPILSQQELELYQVHPEKDPSERFDPVKHQSLDDAQIAINQSAVALEKSKLFPAVHAGYINHHIAGLDNYNGWMVGVSVPLWPIPQKSRIRQAEIDSQISGNEIAYQQFANRQHVANLQSLLNEYFVQISFSKENLVEEAILILMEVEEAFSDGVIKDYAAIFTKVYYAMSAKLNHLEFINQYNQTALELEFYTQ